jgi:hypothetical protein
MDKYENFVKEWINKQLQKHGVDFEYVLKNQQIEGELWCTHYTCTQEEADELKEWAFAEMKKRFKWSKRMCESQYSWISMMWGLRIASETL